ncbi:pyruvate kinase [Saccharolobus solfataricus]|uniref:Pyruvate kinase n=2 Tax=Saccharolobus solfataricus TaxID=2287 RepID=A0A0E3KC56_SACSO|nr:pyruvate kinase [Saccharolobus solfataricus]AKA74207.1 pyruvate kinase [Saccharolobus solfataricus]AKA76905.1 pyruvate kinase [Saccharolobus solfataricus]AKA79597.1 pyruvate kinase [Saccharolobus solfataricus]AZF68688.1 pyruvate kinase [Saccharolobus solfataricus]AZF71308.1 pyruvate kinase [Saccharolobus solfataricus]
MRKTKIVATLGPSSEEKVKELAEYVDVFRINFAHGDETSHRKYFDLIRTYAPESSIIVDLPGPKLRLGELKEPIEVKKGDKIVFSQKDGIPVDDELFYSAVKENSDILIADGTIRVRVKSKAKDRVEGTVIEGGILLSRKGINIPNVNLKSGITDNDLKLLKRALDLGADYIGLSFVISENDVKKVKEFIGDEAWVIAKIEKSEALKNLTNIVNESDGIMVARGDLGVETGLENLPLIQRRIVRTSRVFGKPVILATQVLTSMINSPIPTRAEIIDISNSIMQGVDSIMLSDETAIGNYPVESVRTLHNIISNVEKSVKHRPIGPLNSESDAIALAAVNASKVSKADVIVVYSRSGNSILRVSRLRPERNIIGVSPDPRLAKKFKLCYGVIPISINKKMQSIDEIIDVSAKLMQEKIKDLKFKKIVIVGGDPKQEAGKTNFVIVKTLEQQKK